MVNNQQIIQGLSSLEINPTHVYMYLVESAAFYKEKTKVYAGVPGNIQTSRLKQRHKMQPQKTSKIISRKYLENEMEYQKGLA